MRPLRIHMQAFGPFAGVQVIDFTQLGEKTFFLIHGPTGAGKTTILDAMCFALFGDSSGGERQAPQMRSHHADPATLTEVSMEFTLGQERYRVMRIPEQKRPARRGGGETTQLQKAELHRLDGDAQHPVASGWRNVTEAAVRLLGFESAQFRQVILLPQGQFFEFLKSSSQEREKILQVLFGTEVYRRIEERLARQANELAAQASTVQTRRETLLQQAQVADEAALAERQKALAAEVVALQAAELAAARTDREAEGRLTVARQMADRFTEHDQAEAALKLLLSQEAAQSARRAALDRARAASALSAYALAAAQAAATVADETRALATRQAEHATAVREAALAETALQAQQQRGTEGEELQRTLVKLEELQLRTRGLDEARGAVHSAQAQATQAATARASAETAARQAADHHARLSGQWQAQQLLAARAEGLQVRLEQLQGHLTKSASLAKARAEAASASRDLVARSTEAAASKAAEARARNERDTLTQAWVASQAARLAEALAADEPCPVCGSAHHPDPAHLRAREEGAAIVRDDVLEAAEEALRLVEAAHRQALVRQDEATRTLQALGVRIEELQAELQEVTQDEAQLKQAMQAVQGELQAASAASTGLAALQRQVEQAGQGMTQAKASADAAMAAEQAAVSQHQQAQAVLAERLKDIPADLAQPGQIERACAQASLQLAALRKALQEAEAHAARARQALGQAQANLQAADASLQRASQHHALALRERDQRLRAAGFETLEAYEAARRAEEVMAKEEAELRQFDADLGAARQRLQRAAAEVQDKQRPDLAALVDAHRQAEAAHLRASNAVRDGLAVQKGVAELAAALAEQAAEHQRLQARYGVIKRVADLANGVGGQRMSFQRYVLATLLEEVLAATSVRLRAMSKNRYELRRAATPGDRRAAAGLDLEAFDQYTGTVRPVTTLSGGESFLTSLALALGLSDVVQSHAGGIRLDAIFVDEGFGTLDTEALDFAIRALKDLQQAGRLVGIISHVTELREWIDARLEVRAGAAGSTAEFML